MLDVIKRRIRGVVFTPKRQFPPGLPEAAINVGDVDVAIAKEMQKLVQHPCYIPAVFVGQPQKPSARA